LRGVFWVALAVPRHLLIFIPNIWITATHMLTFIPKIRILHDGRDLSSYF
jgi:hypothetical protein